MSVKERESERVEKKIYLLIRRRNCCGRGIFLLMVDFFVVKKILYKYFGLYSSEKDYIFEE